MQRSDWENPNSARLPRPRGITDRRGSVSVVGALFLLSTALIVVFITQVSDLYIIKMKAQRTADLAALAAAMAATPVISAEAASTAAIGTALDVATLNGFGTATVNTTGAPSGQADYTLSTTISTTPATIIGTWLSGATPVVSAMSQVSVAPTSVTDCIATIGGTVQISDTASVTGSSCAVGSQSTITMSGGTTSLQAIAVGANQYSELPLLTGGTLSSGSVSSNFLYNATITNTAATNAAVVALQNHLQGSWPYATTIPQTAQSEPISTGPAKNFGAGPYTVPAHSYFGAVTLNGTTLNFAGSGGPDIGCAMPTTISGATTLNGSNTLNFASGCYIFGGDVSTDHGSSITNFNINAGATVVLSFYGSININVSLGGSLNFGAAESYSIIGNINVNNNGAFNITSGTKRINGNIVNTVGYLSFGDGDTYLNGGTISGGVSGSITFGNGSFYLWNVTLNNPGASAITFGTGPFYLWNCTISNGTAGTSKPSYLSFGGSMYFYGGSLNTYDYASTTLLGPGNIDFYNSGNMNIGGPTTLNGSNSSGGGTISFFGGNLSVTSSDLNLIGGTVALTTGALNVSAP
jgi:hypothetical protein